MLSPLLWSGQLQRGRHSYTYSLPFCGHWSEIRSNDRIDPFSRARAGRLRARRTARFQRDKKRPTRKTPVPPLAYVRARWQKSKQLSRINEKLSKLFHRRRKRARFARAGSPSQPLLDGIKTSEGRNASGREKRNWSDRPSSRLVSS